MIILKIKNFKNWSFISSIDLLVKTKNFCNEKLIITEKQKDITAPVMYQSFKYSTQKKRINRFDNTAIPPAIMYLII